MLLPRSRAAPLVIGEFGPGKGTPSGAVQLYQAPDMMAGAARVNTGPSGAVSVVGGGGTGAGSQSSTQVAIRKAPTMPKPVWHAPWKLYRVISGHMGWVRCVTVEPGNEWFATGAADRVIKIWDLASGKLKLSLTGHVSVVRGLAVSNRQPYLFSCGEDRQVKCWDLEYNKVIRHYHGHLSAVYDLALHPTLDVLVSAGRDSVARVWDMRTKVNIHTLAGHTNTVTSVLTQSTDPQVYQECRGSRQVVPVWDPSWWSCSPRTFGGLSPAGEEEWGLKKKIVINMEKTESHSFIPIAELRT